MTWLLKLAAAASLSTALASFAPAADVPWRPHPSPTRTWRPRPRRPEARAQGRADRREAPERLHPRGAGKGIKDLTGLEKCKNLALLKLTKNQVADLKPLKDLVNLESLDLADNAIKDIAPLANLKGLQYIELSNNKVENLAPLGGLTSPDVPLHGRATRSRTSARWPPSTKLCVALAGEEPDQGHRGPGEGDQALGRSTSGTTRSRTSARWRSRPS